MLVSQFLLGLKDDLSHAVEMHLPDTVTQSATLAVVQEHPNDKSRHYHRKYTGAKSDSKPSVGSSDLWKARQLKEFRRANILCFKCGDKYSPTHTCKTPKGSLHMLKQVSSDGEMFLSDEVLDMLEQPQLHLPTATCHYMHYLVNHSTRPSN
jgi:hypothetical protein